MRLPNTPFFIMPVPNTPLRRRKSSTTVLLQEGNMNEYLQRILYNKKEYS